MKKRYDNTDSYHIFMYNKILELAPVVGICAAVTFTIARLLGMFAFVETAPLVVFDVICISYFAAAYAARKIGIVRHGMVSEKAMHRIDILLNVLIILQWNLISYIFPTRNFWGFAPMFVMLSAFTFHARSVLMEIAGISASIAVSWMILGDKLLPYHDEFYTENFILRVVALVISFSVIYVLTGYAEKFTIHVKEGFSTAEKQNEELESMSRDIIDFTADLIEERDTTSGAHVKRLKAYTKILAEQISNDFPEYGLSQEKIDQISMASALHDVGKIAIPDSILLKPGKLTPEEFNVIKTHTTLGAQIIEKLPDSVGEEYKRYCRDICRYHHEKYDGKGYPVGLKGDDIPISAQIVSVVDCFDALSNERPYKKALPGNVAIDMILNGECGAFSDKMKSSIAACREKLLDA